LPSVARTGYNFDGWFTAATGGTQVNVTDTTGSHFASGSTVTLYAQWTVSAKNLTISKTLTGAYADMTKAFDFTVYFQDSAGVPLASGTQFTYTGTAAPSGGTLMLDSEGKATFTLSHGQTITIAGVSTSSKVRIVETTDANYTTSFVDSVAPSMIVTAADTGIRNMTSADRTFAFTNARIAVTPAGISTGGNALTLLAVLAIMAGLAAMVAYRRRRKEG